MRSIVLFILTLFLISCSAPRPTPKRNDAVLSGQETAEKAGESARAAEKEGRTGIIIASSEGEDEPTTQPATSETPAPRELKISFVKGTATMSGEPIVDVAAVFADAASGDGEVVLVITSDTDTEHSKVVELIDEANAAGIERVRFDQAKPSEESAPKP